MRQRLVLLSTDAIHHVYFVNRLLAQGFELDAVFYETHALEPPFPVEPVFDEAQREFEEAEFRRDLPATVPADLPVFYYRSLNEPEAVAHIARYEPEIGIVFGCGKLAPTVIRCFPILLNIHKGLAEEYRGLDTDLWPIYHFELDSIGVTVHQVDEELDTGPVAKSARVPLHRGMRIEQLRHAWVVLATEMVMDCLRQHTRGKLALRKQARVGRYYSFMPTELKRLVARRFNAYCRSLQA